MVNDRWGKECRHKHGGYWTTEYAAGMKDDSPSVGGKPRHGLFLRLQPRRTDRRLQDGPANSSSTLVRPGEPRRQPALDIGPAADGTIPPIMEQRLLEIGDWLRVNGEAIYGTRFAGPRVASGAKASGPASSTANSW